MSCFDPQFRSAEQLAQAYKNMSMREFKAEAADMISNDLTDIREKYNRLISADASLYLDEVSKRGASKAELLAKQTMFEVRRAIGLS